MYILPMKAFDTPTKYDFKLTPENPFSVYHGFGSPSVKMAKPDTHYSLHLGILLKGGFEVVYSDYTQVIKPGNVWFCGSWEPHASHRIGLETELILITILPEKIGAIGLDGEINWILPFVMPVSDRPQIVSEVMRSKVLLMSRKICEISDQKDSGWNILCWLKLHELLLLLIHASGFDNRPKVKVQNTAFARVQPAINLVKEMNGVQISLDDAAKVCYLGKSSFCDLFKTAMGTTFAKYAARTRISMAAMDIKKNNSLIKEVADAWGFFDESHFYRAFKQYFHCSPSEYRSTQPDSLTPIEE